MELNYLCPKCNSYLNIGNKVVFSAHVKNNQKGLLLFEKELGNYEVKKNDLIDYKEGEEVGFYCPICHDSLTSLESDSLIKVIQVDANNNHFDVFFSKIAGEKATYKITEEGVEAYGSNSDKYIELIKKAYSII